MRKPPTKKAVTLKQTLDLYKPDTAEAPQYKEESMASKERHGATSDPTYSTYIRAYPYLCWLSA